ncbi:hypothetical protein J6590_071104 [Homalodisca vitripennis]|nr:hypothetical protein J6590_071104 [Homalodisca vitripennis]
MRLERCNRVPKPHSSSNECVTRRVRHCTLCPGERCGVLRLSSQRLDLHRANNSFRRDTGGHLDHRK